MAWHTNPEGLMRRSRKAFGDWLSGFEWDWYTTHTFRSEYVSPREADRHWYSWLNSLRLSAQIAHLPAPFYFRVVEYQDRGTLHYHSLIGNCGDIRRLTFKDYWELFGFGRVEKYEAGKGANYYVGKYLTKADGDIRWSHNLKANFLKQLENSFEA